MTPTHTFDVDLTNPGQFLACCGLLELANAVDDGALGWFSAGQFFLSTHAEALVSSFLTCPALPDASPSLPSASDEEDKSPPLTLADPFGIRLDWWEDPATVRAGFKTWGGGQTVLGFFDGMRQRVQEANLPHAELLTRGIVVKTKKPFYFDSRLSVLTSLDLGSSPEEYHFTYSPAVEALALVALQRYRPAAIALRETYSYSTWTEPLPSLVAAAVTNELTPTLAYQNFKFPFVVRTGGKYKAFGPAILSRSNAHE